ncbi:transcriptional regulator [Acrocarpospora corrugata]|uniref:Transcriptional regulator n=1 Tax=Acrocarpospora corrugata TaxID=35763 RepID=A0A5M3VWQ8_9ACTN|nr:helix-turn-helix transcriptional regulator [Acrocarpospora corrugata]GES01255.1 transcriptional regulator [Acrocarpospora corrugata]
MTYPNSFGAVLHELRGKADWTLSRLAREVYYSKGHLSKIENGLKVPSPDLARRCDAVLKANGALIALAANDVSDPIESATAAIRPFAISMSVTGADMHTGEEAEGASLRFFRAAFDSVRLLGQTAHPRLVLPLVVTQTEALQALAGQAGGRTRLEWLALAARFAEYAGWMAQESGDNEAALSWTEQAVAMAAPGPDRDLESYAKIRRALITFYNNDAAQTVALARQAQLGTNAARIRGLAAQREAQGHALAGDYDACFRSLDQARELLADAEQSEAPVLGTTNLPDSVAMITGWCLYDLGRAREAAEVLDRECARLSPHALRTHARYGVRRARAHAAVGEIDHACQLTAELLDTVRLVRSATIGTDLRQLAHTLLRYQQSPSVRALHSRLMSSLRLS